MARIEPGKKYPAVWYSPSDIEHKQGVAGLFWVTEKNNRPMAAIHQAFDDDEDELVQLFTGSRVFDVLDGRLMGENVTLENARVVHSQRDLNDQTLIEMELHATRALVGPFWLESYEFTYDEVEVKLWDQDAWTDWPIPQINYDAGLTVFEHKKPEVVAIPSMGAEVTLEDDFRWTRIEDIFTLKPDSLFRLKLAQPLDFADLSQRWLAPLRHMIISATARRTGIRSLTVRNSAWTIAAPERLGDDGWLTMIVAHPDRPSGELSGGYILFQRGDFPADYDYDLVWNATRLNRFAIDQYANIKSGFSGGASTTFVAIAQALESLDRSYHDEIPKPDQDVWREKVNEFMLAHGAPSSLRSAAKYALKYAHRMSLEGRLSRLNTETGGIIESILPPKTTWFADVAKARNVIAHGLEKAELLALDLRGVETATAICELLFELRWLTLIGFTAERAYELSARRGWYANTVKMINDNYEHLASLARQESVDAGAVPEQQQSETAAASQLE